MIIGNTDVLCFVIIIVERVLCVHTYVHITISLFIYSTLTCSTLIWVKLTWLNSVTEYLIQRIEYLRIKVAWSKNVFHWSTNNQSNCEQFICNNNSDNLFKNLNIPILRRQWFQVPYVSWQKSHHYPTSERQAALHLSLNLPLYVRALGHSFYSWDNII